MQLKEFSVTLGQLITEFQFELIYGPEGFEKIEITTDDVNRPGLQLAGFFDYFEPQRLQIMGKAENAYVEQFDEEKRTDIFEKLCATGIPAVIVTRNIEVFPELIEAAKKYDVAVLRTNEFTSSVTSALVASLKVSLAPRITLHGVLVELYGEGILILGDSGVGKSETAIELVKRGHRLIADDAVEIRKVSSRQLVGNAPEVLRHYIELRGIGVINVAKLFGMGAVKDSCNIDLIINMVPWRDGEAYDRLGIETQYTEILDVKVPSITIPITPGRNLAVIFEVAAINNRQKRMGYNAAMEFTEQMSKFFANKDD